MKTINQHNYEEYAIEYMTGNLDPDTERAFSQFISENVDIADEILLFDQSNLEIHNKKTNSFDRLHKDINDISINASNFEEFCIASAENDLSDKGEKALKAYIGTNNTLKQDAESYKHLKLIATKEVFEHKNKLKQSIHKPFFHRRLITIASAGAAAIILFIGLLSSPAPQQESIQELSMISSFHNFEIESKTSPSSLTRKTIIASPEKPKQQALILPQERIQKKHNENKTTIIERGVSNDLKLRTLTSIKPIITYASSIKVDHLTLANPTKTTNPSPQEKREGDSKFKQLARNYIYTKVLTQGIEGINNMAETDLNYTVVKNEQGAPIKVIFSTRFGTINHTLALQ